LNSISRCLLCDTGRDGDTITDDSRSDHNSPVSGLCSTFSSGLYEIENELRSRDSVLLFAYFPRNISDCAFCSRRTSSLAWTCFRPKKRGVTTLDGIGHLRQ